MPYDENTMGFHLREELQTWKLFAHESVGRNWSAELRDKCLESAKHKHSAMAMLRESSTIALPSAQNPDQQQSEATNSSVTCPVFHCKHRFKG